MTLKRGLLLIVSLHAAANSQSYATTFYFGGTVTATGPVSKIQDFAVGDPFRGYITFDPSTRASNIRHGQATYWDVVDDAAITFGEDYVYRLSRDKGINNDIMISRDSREGGGFNALLPLSGPPAFFEGLDAPAHPVVGWIEIEGAYETTFDSLDLPQLPPDLSQIGNYPSMARLRIQFDFIDVAGEITYLVPEPSSLVMLLSIFATLRPRRLALAPRNATRYALRASPSPV